MVIIMGVQTFDGQEHRYVDYAIADVLQMMGRACRPTQDTSSRCILMCQQTRKDFFKKFLNEALPVESSLPGYLHDHFNAEIVAKTIENKQDAVDWCTWTWFYRRLMQNPGFYNLQGTTPTHVADYLSELVETTLSDLVQSDCIIIQDEMDTLANNLGMIASFYYISYVTVETFSASIKETTKLKGLLEIVSSANEYEHLPIRHHEDTLLERIYDRVPVKVSKADYSSPYFKAYLLLQAHFSRMTLPPDLAIDQATVLAKVTNLLSACVDVMSSKSYLGCLGAMDLSQMCVQGLWDQDSPLKQVPYFDQAVLARFKKEGLNQVYDIADLEDDKRAELLQMSDRQLYVPFQYQLILVLAWQNSSTRTPTSKCPTRSPTHPPSHRPNPSSSTSRSNARPTPKTPTTKSPTPPCSRTRKWCHGGLSSVTPRVKRCMPSKR